MKMKYLLFVLVVFILKMVNASGYDCGITPIESWSGSSSKRTESLPQPINLVVVQHTVTTECMTDEACTNLMSALRRYQIETGLIDLGMSYVIGGNGVVYEGAGWRVGAHTRGFNDRSISISFLGDFRYKLPTPEALYAAKNLLACMKNLDYLGTEYKLVGHQQLSATLSPGAELQSFIETWPHWTNDLSDL